MENKPTRTSAELVAASKHFGFKCHNQNMAFLKCKEKNPDGECRDTGNKVLLCVLGVLKDLHQKCQREMDAYTDCMFHHNNEYEKCVAQKEAFEFACPFD